MQHESHYEEGGLGIGAKIIAVIAMLAVLGGVGAYVVYGSGMWNPPVKADPYAH